MRFSQSQTRWALNISAAMSFTIFVLVIVKCSHNLASCHCCPAVNLSELGEIYAEFKVNHANFRRDFETFAAAYREIEIKLKQFNKFTSTVAVANKGKFLQRKFNGDWPIHRRHDEPVMNMWQKTELSFCSNNFRMVPAGFARLRNLVLDTRKARGRRGGGEMSQASRVKIHDGFWQLQSGFFNILCEDHPNQTPVASFTPKFRGDQTYVAYYHSVALTIKQQEMSRWSQKLKKLPGTLMALTQYWYYNLYHIITDVYNVYCHCLFYGLDPTEVSILHVDGHPKNPQMSEIWQTLFNGKEYRVGELEAPVVIDDLIWVLWGDFSEVMHPGWRLPYHREFRQFFLSRFGFRTEDVPELNCSSVRVTFLWRRDHRRPGDLPNVTRKIENEQEIVREVANNFPNVVITQHTFEKMSFKEQLRVMAFETDILIGMHGAAFTHSMFMHEHSGFVEFFPNYLSRVERWFFGGICKWRGLACQMWTNQDPENEISKYSTRIPEGVTSELLEKVLRQQRCL